MVFEYTPTERLMMAIINGISSFSMLPATLIVNKKGMDYAVIFGLFSAITSFFYHICESLDIIILIPQLKWHELDNIGAICCLNGLFFTLTTYFNSLERFNTINYIFLFITLIFQKRGPWEIINTLMPIFLCLGLIAIDLLFKGLPSINKRMIYKGGPILFIGFFFFYKGLDDLEDYLRINHALWHVCVGLSTTYLWQIRDKDEDTLGMKEIFRKERFYLFKENMEIKKKSHKINV